MIHHITKCCHCFHKLSHQIQSKTQRQYKDNSGGKRRSLDRTLRLKVSCLIVKINSHISSQNSSANHYLYSLSGGESYRKIFWSLETARFGFRLFQSLNCLKATWQQRCRDACQISERHRHYNIRFRGFETSGDLSSCKPLLEWLGYHHLIKAPELIWKAGFGYQIYKYLWWLDKV